MSSGVFSLSKVSRNVLAPSRLRRGASATLARRTWISMIERKRGQERTAKLAPQEENDNHGERPSADGSAPSSAGAMALAVDASLGPIPSRRVSSPGRSSPPARPPEPLPAPPAP